MAKFGKAGRAKTEHFENAHVIKSKLARTQNDPDYWDKFNCFRGKNTVFKIIQIIVDENHFIREFSGRKCRFQIYQD